MRLFTLLLAAALVCAAPPASAEIFRVNTGWDFPDPVSDDLKCGYPVEGRDDPFCSLRAAIQEANRRPGEHHSILLGPGIHYLWIRGSDEDHAATGDLDIRGNVTISGEGPAAYSCVVDEYGPEHGLRRGCQRHPTRIPTVIQARHGDRIFHVLPGASMVVGMVTINGGHAPRRTQHGADPTSVGGAILNEGVLNVIETGVYENEAQSGGAIFATETGQTQIDRVTFLYNRARNAAPENCGGALTSEGLLLVVNAIFQYNSAAADGGAICNLSAFTHGSASAFDRRIFASMEIFNSVVIGNVSGGNGGGIATRGDMRVHSANFVVNSARRDGGGIWVASEFGGLSHVQAVRLWRNTADGVVVRGLDMFGRGGGIAAMSALRLSSSTLLENSSVSVGGGLWIGTNDRVDIQGSTLTGNTAIRHGAGMFVDFRGPGDVDLLNSTVTGNRSIHGTGGIAVAGGDSNQDDFMLRSVTLTANETLTGTTANFLGFRSNILFKNSIISAPVGGDNCTLEEAAVTHAGINLEDRADCGFAMASSFVDPLLEPLADHGGATETHALSRGSPALDRIPLGDCDVDPLFPDWRRDQRGVLRPQGSQCDVGAFELEWDLPDWVASGDFFELLFLSSSVVSRAHAFSSTLGGTQEGATLGAAIVTAAVALEAHVDAALHLKDPQQGQARVAESRKPLDTLNAALVPARKCCERELLYLALSEAVTRFADTLARVTQ